jgi:hypothetical protein
MPAEPYQPKTMVKGQVVRTAGTIAEEVALRFDGFRPVGGGRRTNPHYDDETDVHGVKNTRSIVHLRPGGFADVANGTVCQTQTPASRPTPAAIGNGGQIYDATLHKPLWSDGTNWRDAAGTIVS